MDRYYINSFRINSNNNIIMTTIKEHLELEQAKSSPDLKKIEQLARIVKRSTITLEEWRFTADFKPKEESDIKLRSNCNEIIVYAGNVVVQVLKTGEFLYNKIKGTDLEEVENEVFFEVADKFWCDKC